MDYHNAQAYLDKWQKILRLMDWDIKLQFVEVQWRKTGNIKIDMDDRAAILLVNKFNPKQTNMEEVIVHELMHLKLHGMDQMIELLIDCTYGNNDNDSKRKFAYNQFMTMLESTVHDLTKSFLLQVGDNKELSFGRLQKEIKDEIGI